jgi:purine-cytosine permease-like protein
MWATFLGFTLTNILFYFGGLLLGTSDIIGVVMAVQAMFFGFLMLLLVVDEADNAFADVYSAAVSAQNIFSTLNQKHLIIGFAAASAILAMVVSIEQYETFLLIIGAIFVPLFAVVLTDYYIVKKKKYTEEMLYGHTRQVRIKAIASWALGTIVALALSPLVQVYVPELPAIGGTIPSLAVASVVYLALSRIKR